MSTLQNEIARLRTLQESYSELAARVYPTTETVTVNLRTGDGGDVDWTLHAITVLDISDNKQSIYDLNADGTCTFEVPSGHQYSVGFPQLAAYAKPQKQSYASTLYKRHIVYEYNVDTSVEVVRIRTIDGMSQSVVSLLDTTSISIIADTGETYTGTFVGSACDIEIPYGKNCTLYQPFIDGYRGGSGVQTFTTGLSLRSLVLEYTFATYGIFGVDEDGKLYTVDECEALDDKTIIKYGFYNDAALAQSTRVDSGTGNGFYWKIGAESLGSMRWAVQDVLFDTTRLPFMGNASGGNLAEWKYAGMYLSKTIQEIGLELFPDSDNPTPVATACLNKTETFGGKEHQGFLPSYDQILAIATTNRTLFQALYTALGRTAPTLWVDGWWTSCQLGAAYAAGLYNGGFRNGYLKTSRLNVLCCFDL